MNEQLQKGVMVEKEHAPTYLKLKRYVQEYHDLPPLDKFAELIAIDHLKELPDYYDRLAAMEKK